MNTIQSHILLIVDNEVVVRLVGYALDGHYDITAVTSLAAAKAAYQPNWFAVIIIDLNLPDSSGIDSLIAARSLASTEPVIVLTSDGNRRLQKEAINKGANDFYEKQDLGIPRFFLHTVTNVIYKHNLHAQLEEKEIVSRHSQEIARLGAWEVDVQTRAVSWSETTYEIHGVEVGETITLERAMQFFHPDDVAVISQLVERAITRGVEYEVELRLIDSYGQLKWVVCMGEPLFIQGKLYKLLGVMKDVTSYRRINSELKLKVQLLEQMTDAAFVLDNEGKLLYCNRSAEEAYSISQSGCGRQIDGFKDFDTVQKVSQSKRRFQRNIKLVSDTGSEIYLAESYTRMEIDDLEKDAFLCISRNVTLESGFEIQLKSSEEKFRRIFELAPLGMAMIDISTKKFLSCNKAFENLLGLDSESILRLGFEDITPAKYAKQDEKAWNVLLKKGTCEPYRKYFFHNDGHLIPVLVTSFRSRVSSGEDQLWQLALDLTELDEAAKALKDAESKFHIYLEESADVLYTADLDGHFTSFSANLGKVLGYDQQELIGIRMSDCIHPDDQAHICMLFVRARENTDRSQYEKFRMKNAEGKFNWFETNLLVHKAPNAPRQSIGILRSIEEQLSKEAHINWQNSRLKEIAFIQSHILRRPLANILGILEYCKGIGSSSLDMERWLQVLDSEARAMDVIVTDIIFKSASKTEFQDNG